MKRPRSSTSSAPRPPATEAMTASALLRAAFPAAVDVLIRRRRADLLQASSIDAYVQLDWLTWHGGNLKLTIVGENICAQQRREQAA